VKLILEALHGNDLPFINDGKPIEWAPHIPIWLSLTVIVVALGVATIASLISSRGRQRATGNDAEARAGEERPATSSAGAQARAGNERPGKSSADSQARAGEERAETSSADAARDHAAVSASPNGATSEATRTRNHAATRGPAAEHADEAQRVSNRRNATT
jgi:hypothetical protein